VYGISLKCVILVQFSEVMNTCGAYGGGVL